MIRLGKILVITTALLISYVSQSNAFVINGYKWYKNPGKKSYSGKNAPVYGPDCIGCLTTAEMKTAIVQGRNLWPALRGGTGPGIVSASWDKLDRTKLARTGAEFVTGESGCQKCAGSAFLELVSSKTVFNKTKIWQTRDSCTPGFGFDLKGLAAHEFGHAVGLGHSENSSATMRRELKPCDFSQYPPNRRLYQDDQLGYDAIYKNCQKPDRSCQWVNLQFRTRVASCKKTKCTKMTCSEIAEYGCIWCQTQRGVQEIPESGTISLLLEYSSKSISTGEDYVGGRCAHKDTFIHKRGEFEVVPGATYLGVYSFQWEDTTKVFFEDSCAPKCKGNTGTYTRSAYSLESFRIVDQPSTTPSSHYGSQSVGEFVEEGNCVE